MENRLLTRHEASEYIREKGLPASSATLRKLACVGGGPKFRRFGRHVRYDPSDLNAWIESRLSKPLASTSEAV